MPATCIRICAACSRPRAAWSSSPDRPAPGNPRRLRRSSRSSMPRAPGTSSPREPARISVQNRRALIRQREVPTHTPSFEQGIVDALRENPDVLVIGEMRTPEVMRLSLPRRRPDIWCSPRCMRRAVPKRCSGCVCLPRGSAGERARATGRLPGGRELPAARLSCPDRPACASLRAAAANLRRTRYHPRRQLQPVGQGAAVGRRGGCGRFALPALDGPAARLGAAAPVRRPARAGGRGSAGRVGTAYSCAAAGVAASRGLGSAAAAAVRPARRSSRSPLRRWISRRSPSSPRK